MMSTPGLDGTEKKNGYQQSYLLLWQYIVLHPICYKLVRSSYYHQRKFACLGKDAILNSVRNDLLGAPLKEIPVFIIINAEGTQSKIIQLDSICC